MGKLFAGPIRLGWPIRLLHADRRRCRRRQAADGQSIPEDMMENLQGRRVLVTGGSRRLGLAMVEALLARGAEVTVLAPTRARLRNAEQLGADAIEGDATDAPLMDGLVADIAARFSSLKARHRVRTWREDPIFMPDQTVELPSEALLLNERTHTMFSNAAIARHKASLQKLIDQVINAGLIALVGCSIAAALAIGVPTSADSSQTAMPMSEWRSLFDQGVFRASSHEPRLQRLVGTVNAPVGQGWG
jgi:NAD(P)-dependent dehydrogenase (short-subunit alcohol dehydrogenase family)